MTTTPTGTTHPGTAPAPADRQPASSTTEHCPRVLIGVEVATLDQYGDPGFVHYRGDFHTGTAAAGFAITQAHNVITTYEPGRVAAALTDHTHNDPTGRNDERSTTVIGSTGEIACALAADPTYAAGVRRVHLPPPADVLDIIAATISDSTVSDDSSNADGDSDGDGAGWFVHIRTVRPGPIPDSKTVLGPLPHSAAESAAGLLAQRLGGDITAHPDRGIITVRHHGTVTDEDEQAVQRYDRITAARAQLATLPVGSVEHHRLLTDLAAAAYRPGDPR
ncbi:methyltransferase [Rhodococcoides fascians]|uniref:methyltransferase n=1 Tax=Rhodococcoides fascians TaxID=1828 RepID=UPI0012FD5600|nr:methyltransferase [Rhodococcus fascians]